MDYINSFLNVKSALHTASDKSYFVMMKYFYTLQIQFSNIWLKISVSMSRRDTKPQILFPVMSLFGFYIVATVIWEKNFRKYSLNFHFLKVIIGNYTIFSLNI
jgi:hypothetical protein